MEDNNYRHEEFDNCFMCNHPILKHVLAGLLIFLGAFAAFYVVSDWHFKRMMDPALQMRKFDRAMMREQHKIDRDLMKQQYRMDKMARKEMARQQQIGADFIHMDKTDDAYKIIIDLRPFDNDEKNIETRINGKSLSVTAAGENTTRHKKEIIRYSQNFTFGDDVDLGKMSKVREGDKYIITVPID